MYKEANFTIGQLIQTKVKFLWPISGHENIIKLLKKRPQTLLILNIKIIVSYNVFKKMKIIKIIIF